MTDNELIQQAIETCIHQMCDVTVGVEDIEAALEQWPTNYVKYVGGELTEFRFKPAGQFKMPWCYVIVKRREDVPDFFPWLNK